MVEYGRSGLFPDSWREKVDHVSKIPDSCGAPASASALDGDDGCPPTKKLKKAGAPAASQEAGPARSAKRRKVSEGGQVSDGGQIA